MTRLAIAACVLLIVLFPFVYPVANRGLTGGSDRDEALNLAAHNLWAGRYLYEGRTYLGGPITALPGAILLAAPFVALGNAAYQNPFWLAVLLVVLWRLAWRRGAIAFLLLALNPLTLREYFTGGDLFANSAYMLVAVLWLLRAEDKRLPALFFGLVLASRALFWPVAIPVFACLWHRRTR